MLTLRLITLINCRLLFNLHIRKRCALPLFSSCSRKMISLSVDGNISSGKSTLVSRMIELLSKNGLKPYGGHVGDGDETLENPYLGLQVDVIPEPLEKWCNVEGHNVLEMFYKDPERYNFLFEHYVQLTRLMDIVRTTGDVGSSPNKQNSKAKLHLRVMERSLQNNRYCFMELAKKRGKLHPAEFGVLAEWYKWFEAHINIDLDLIIYLRTDPKTAYDRMKSRARAAEDLCPFEYLVDLHEAYEEWLIRNPVGTKRTHVIVVDANQNKNEVAADCFLKLNEYLDNLLTVRSSVPSAYLKLGLKRKLEEPYNV